MVKDLFELAGMKADEISKITKDNPKILIQQNSAGQNLLHHIAQYREDTLFVNKVNALLSAIAVLPEKEKKEFLNAQDRQNNTALDIAAQQGKWEMVDTLLSQSAQGDFKKIMLKAIKSDPAVNNETKRKIFAAMLQSKNTDKSLNPESTIEEFLKTKDGQGKSALDYMEQDQNKDFLTSISKNKKKVPQLMAKIREEEKQKKQEEMSKTKETDVNHQEFSLHNAAKEGNLGIVTFLLDQGADLTKKDGAGKTPLQYAYDSKDKETKDFLEKRIISSITDAQNNINSKNIEAYGLKKESVILNAMGHEGRTIDGVNPIQYAINEGITIDGKDPLLFVLAQEQIKDAHPISYLANNDIKIEDKDLVRLMTDNKEYLNKAVESYQKSQQGSEAKDSQALYEKFLKDMKIENKVSGYNFFKKLLNTISGGKLYKHTVLAEEFKKLIGGRLESASSSEHLTPSATPIKKGNAQGRDVGH